MMMDQILKLKKVILFLKMNKNYKTLVKKYWGYADQDIPLCFNCENDFAVDWHHIESRQMGGNKKKILYIT